MKNISSWGPYLTTKKVVNSASLLSPQDFRSSLHLWDDALIFILVCFLAQSHSFFYTAFFFVFLFLLFDWPHGAPQGKRVCSLFFYVYFAFSAVHTCHALLTYSRQALLDINSSHRLTDFTESIPQELQHIVLHRSHHHHWPWEGPETSSSSELADPRKVRRLDGSLQWGWRRRCVCVKSTTRGAEIYGLLISTVCQIWSFHCWNAVPTIYWGNLLPCFLPLFTSHHESTPGQCSANFMTSSAASQEMAHLDAVFVAAGDFNHCNLKTVFPQYYQHVDITTHHKLNKSNSGPQTLRPSLRTVLLGQSGMCLKLQPLFWRTLLSAYRTMLSMWPTILALVSTTLCPPYKSRSFPIRSPGLTVRYVVCCVPALLHLNQVTRRSKKLRSTDWKKPSQWPTGSTPSTPTSRPPARHTYTGSPPPPPIISSGQVHRVLRTRQHPWAEHLPMRLMFSHPSSTLPSATAPFSPASRPQPSSCSQEKPTYLLEWLQASSTYSNQQHTEHPGPPATRLPAQQVDLRCYRCCSPLFPLPPGK